MKSTTILKFTLLFLAVVTVVLFMLNRYSAETTQVVYYTISYYGYEGNETVVGVRFYVSNPSPLAYYVLNATATVYAQGQVYRASLGDAWIPAHRQAVYEVFARFKGHIGGPVKAHLSFLKPVYILYLFEVYAMNYTAGGPVRPGLKMPFLWAGWNTTVIDLHHCAEVEARSYPSQRITVLVVEDLVGSKDRVVTSYEGYGSFSRVFCPEKPSGLNFKGYYLEVTGGGATWVQPDGYPPRLTVAP